MERIEPPAREVGGQAAGGTSISTQAAAQLERAATWLCNGHPFYGLIAIALPRLEDRSLDSIGLVLRDGKPALHYNATAVCRWSTAETAAAIAHEALHLLLRHPARGGARTARLLHGGKLFSLWNLACDAAVNQWVRHELRLPAGAIFPETLGLPRGEAAERYYRLMEQQLESGGTLAPQVLAHLEKAGGDEMLGGAQLDDHRSWAPDVALDDSREDASSRALDPVAASRERAATGSGDENATWDSPEVEEHVARLIESIALASRSVSFGHLPGQLVREARLPTPVERCAIPWNELLRRMVGWETRVGWRTTIKRPSRRYPKTQPGRLPLKRSTVAIVVDTSGSIHAAWLGIFIAEVKSIVRAHGSAPAWLIEADAAVQNIRRLEASTILGKLKGGGGTDFRPAIDHARRWDPGLLIYLTDLAGAFPDRPPAFPVIWVVPPKNSCTWAPFGKVIVMDEGRPQGRAP